MEGAFDLNTRIFLSLNSRLPYGDKSPQMDFFDAAFKGDLRRVRGQVNHPSPTSPLPPFLPSPSYVFPSCDEARGPRRPVRIPR
jgi:hypothetical protein